jgi:hypothetical protein
LKAFQSLSHAVSSTSARMMTEIASTRTATVT